ncbi:MULTISPECIES: hypothetical protein [Streptomyces]|uniref:Uncharacterized protein n=1 Tax=Streptomyces anulatus TaxID=1892 RepID=A0A7K3RLH4_STRAQ|nr:MULTISPECIES: hypothetical protein [Streptomyces]NEC02827.1 hypothetical protein [Streptomyces anulatus]NED26383.1 hypothetical protein [Streptomyces anulatus]OLO34650.1 hypothetical protein PZ61_0231855 [Streptomyces sp. MNU77]OWA17271.1 hypothetical protein B9W61_32530 [Streptomyces sp. CS057]
MAGRYYFDPHRVASLTEQQDQIADLAMSILTEFRDDVYGTAGWVGTAAGTDEMSQKATERDREETQKVTETMTGFRDALSASTAAMKDQIYLVRSTRDTNLEGISKYSSRAEAHGVFGDDTGGHGRR